MKKVLALLSIVIGIAALIFAAEAGQKKESPPPVGASLETSAPESHVVLNPTDLQWGDAPPGLPPGAKMAVLMGDPGKPGPFTTRMNAPAGYTVRPHTHPTTERLTVISGTFRVGMGDKFDEVAMKDLTAGGYVVLPPGMQHFAKAKSDTIVQIDSEGPFQINYVNPADDPRNAKK
jgi:quercetin dioxygenase-like cupin family protein